MAFIGDSRFQNVPLLLLIFSQSDTHLPGHADGCEGVCSTGKKRCPTDQQNTDVVLAFVLQREGKKCHFICLYHFSSSTKDNCSRVSKSI